MKGYEHWSFRDRTFLTAGAVSVGWHVFWFFAIAVVVSPSAGLEKPHPNIVSLGPVLDDSIFRALVENKPELSETFYRHMSDFSSPSTPPVQTIERYSAGDVVSIPVNRRFLQTLKGVVGGQKASPEYTFQPKLGPALPEEAQNRYVIQGEAGDRRVLSRPADPLPLNGLEGPFHAGETEIEFTLDASGSVVAAEVTLSSGVPDIDLQWVRYLRQWQFEPLALDRPGLNQKGRVRFRADEFHS